MHPAFDWRSTAFRVLALASLLCLVVCDPEFGSSQPIAETAETSFPATLDTTPSAAAIVYPAPPAKVPTDPNDPFPPSYFAICTVVKDQHADLREWLYYHHWLGAETIYLYVSAFP
jgi:hypothetical protein